MPRIADLNVLEPASIAKLPIDFTLYLPAGGSLSSAVFSFGVYLTIPGFTADPSPASRLIGSPGVSGNVATQEVSGLVDGNDYLLTCAGTMADGQVVVLWTVLPCRSPGDA